MIKGKDYIGVGVGASIINENNEILLLLRNKAPEAGCWCIPGGSVELFETIEAAIKREVKEEIDVEIEILDYLGLVDHIVSSEGVHWVAAEFIAKIVEGNIKNMEPKKHLDVRWFNVNQLPENITITTKKALEFLAKKR